jgi:DNA-binding response OmpR family regulator
VGFDHHLVKPIDLDVLLSLIDAHAERDNRVAIAHPDRNRAK